MIPEFHAVSSLRISSNRRFLADATDAPFFWMGDTAWTLLQRLDRQESLDYLDDRAAKGFNVAQVMGIMEFDGLRVPSAANGEVPLLHMDPTRPNEKYWAHCEWLITEAAKRGILLALLPIWGDKWNITSGIGPQIFDAQNAAVYGEWLGRRFRDFPLIWVLGGDRKIENDGHKEIMRAMARGLQAGDGGRNLMTFHPPGQHSSAEWFHDDAWLDFNMWQTGHSFSGDDNARFIEQDYARLPAKPVLDGEPRYEDHPIRWRWDDPAAWDASNGYFDDRDARQAAYAALFAGACGHTYGANSVFQCYREGQPDRFGARRSWREALDLPGARQMRWVRNLMESRPFFSRVPDQSLLLGGEDSAPSRILATRDAAGAYAMVYIPSGQSVSIDLNKLNRTATGHWFDPQNGKAEPCGRYSGVAQDFTPPSQDDWILVLDEPGREFAPPGQGAA